MLHPPALWISAWKPCPPLWLPCGFSLLVGAAGAPRTTTVTVTHSFSHTSSHGPQPPTSSLPLSTPLLLRLLCTSDSLVRGWNHVEGTRKLQKVPEIF